MSAPMRAFLVVTLLSSACAGIPLPRESLSDPGALLYNGYTSPKVDCFRCHNGDGTGVWGPSLVKRVPRLKAEKLATVIRQGPGSMPKYEADVLSDAELQQLVDWLKGSFVGAP